MSTYSTIGTCRFKCPLSEIEMRQKNGLLHCFELLDEDDFRQKKYPAADTNKMVKEYSRPAAGCEHNIPETLRPPDILLATVQYLVTNICMRDNCPWSDIYEFVFDRLRAVRQDMVIQSLDDTAAVHVLQTTIAFHIYSAYRLCSSTPDIFDEKINSTHTQECLKRLLCLYQEAVEAEKQDLEIGKSYNAHDSKSQCARESVKDKITDVAFITEGVERLNCQSDQNQDSVENNSKTVSICRCRQAEYMSLYLLFNLGSIEAVRLGMEWRKLLSKNYFFHVSLSISKAWLVQNYARVLRLCDDLPPLMLCAVHRHLQNIHRASLLRMSYGYSSKNLTFPLRDLTCLLHCDDDTETARLCEHYELAVTGNRVRFSKDSFNQTKELPSAKHYDWISGHLQEVPIDYLMLGECCHCVEEYAS